MPGHYYIPALYNAAIKSSVYECFITHAFHILCTYTQSIMNALLECIKFYLVHIGNVLLESIHLTCIQLFVITVYMFALLLQELDLLQYNFTDCVQL